MLMGAKNHALAITGEHADGILGLFLFRRACQAIDRESAELVHRHRETETRAERRLLEKKGQTLTFERLTKLWIVAVLFHPLGEREKLGEFVA